MKHTKTKFFTLVASLLIVSTLLGFATVARSESPKRSSLTLQKPVQYHVMDPAGSRDRIDPLDFRQAVRKLWEDHILWTRGYIISVLADLPEADAAAQRLLQNQVDIGDAIKPFYGKQASDQLTSLLQEHILIAVELLDAAKLGDTARFEAALQSWYQNADQIATFLNNANPKNWPLSDMKSMMKSHLDLTLEEATARINEDWEADVATYDKVHADILAMADMIATGIVRQFPQKFTHQRASQEEIDLTLAMDKLWEDHITWTRMYIISATSSLPDADAAAQRLLQNQEDIGDAIKPIYGEEAGEQLTALLKEHILIAVELLDAAKAGDGPGFEDASRHWYDNADQIALFLSSANPGNWSLDEMEEMMKSHLDLTLNEAVARLQGNWEADVAAYEKVHEDILEMSAMLTAGILAQFPGQFK